MRVIIINENQLDFIKNNKQNIENNTIEIFNKEVRNFLYHIIKKENNEISDYWRINGIKKTEIFKELKKYGVIIEDDNGNISIPKKNFDKKVDRVYYSIFNGDEPGLIMTEDDGGTSCSSVGGSYEAPVFGVQRRKIAKI